MRAVLDTNVLASGFVRPEPPPGQILMAWQAFRFELVTSEHILDELATTFDEPYFRTHLSQEQRESNLRLVREMAEAVETSLEVRGVATHPEDDRILATAVSADADYLVTGDRKLLALESYEGVSIVSPRQFLAILAED